MTDFKDIINRLQRLKEELKELNERHAMGIGCELDRLTYIISDLDDMRCQNCKHWVKGMQECNQSMPVYIDFGPEELTECFGCILWEEK